MSCVTIQVTRADMKTAEVRGSYCPTSNAATEQAGPRFPNLDRMGQCEAESGLGGTDCQTVAKHYHISHPPPDSHTSLIDSLSDTFINAFSRVRKPDARFVEMAEGIERYEEGLSSVDRLVGRSKQRVDGQLPPTFARYAANGRFGAGLPRHGGGLPRARLPRVGHH